MAELILSTDLINCIKTSFLAPKEKFNKIKTKPCRIKFGGEIITLGSKKTIWRNKGFARAAFLNHLCSWTARILPKELHNKYGYVDSDTIKLIRDMLEKDGIIEYVEMDF